MGMVGMYPHPQQAGQKMPSPLNVHVKCPSPVFFTSLSEVSTVPYPSSPPPSSFYQLLNTQDHTLISLDSFSDDLPFVLHSSSSTLISDPMFLNVFSSRLKYFVVEITSLKFLKFLGFGNPFSSPPVGDSVKWLRWCRVSV